MHSYLLGWSEAHDQPPCHRRAEVMRRTDGPICIRSVARDARISLAVAGSRAPAGLPRLCCKRYLPVPSAKLAADIVRIAAMRLETRAAGDKTWRN